MVLVVTVAEVVVLLVIGLLLFGVDPPATASRWLVFGWTFLLGVTACSFLGIAASALASSERSLGGLILCLTTLRHQRSRD
jgi:ABC-2 type transport system permease protein